MKSLKGPFCLIAVSMSMVLVHSGAARAESYVLPSSAYRTGANGAEYHTDVRLLNEGTGAVTVTATLYDQVTATAQSANSFQVAARSQVAYDNILQSVFGKTLNQGAFGPIRFTTTGALQIGASVNNVNGCGSGAVSGQWLPAVAAPQALISGIIGQLAVSANGGAGYRTNLVVMNPGSVAATATIKVRQGSGALLSTGTIGPLAANGFSQVALDSGAFLGVAGTTDTNLWLEFTSDQPVLVYATMINNASGDPFAVVATRDAAAPVNPLSGSYSGTYTGSENGTWLSIVAGDSTTVLSVASPSVGHFTGSGVISPTGDLSLGTSGQNFGPGITVSWTGRFQTQGAGAVGSGTWAASNGGSGTWTGTRQ